MKRFWDRADYAEVPGGFAITLDGKPLRLPGVDGRQRRSKRVLAAQ